MTEIVINACYGWFGLSHKAFVNYYNREDRRRDPSADIVDDIDIQRDDPALVAVVKEMGKESWGTYAKLKVVEIPDDVDWWIDEHDGCEKVVEHHREWY